MSDALDPTRKDLLSSRLDHEFAPEVAEDAAANELMTGSFNAQLHSRNLEAVSRATQQAGSPIPPAGDFLSRLMGAIDGLEQEDPAEDFEVLSAWSDGEWELDTVTELAETTRSNIRSLGAAMAKLPVPAAPIGFADRVMAAIGATEAPESATLSALYDSEFSFSDVRCLQQAQLPPAAQIQLGNFSTLSGALRRLSTPEISSGFAERVMAALPALDASVDTDDSFEILSASYDLDADSALPESPALLQAFAALSAAMQALPTPQAPAGFADRVMQAIAAVDTQAVGALHDGEAELSELNQTQEHTLRQLETLSAGFAALPQVTAPAGFAERVFQAIEADFSQVSAHHDGEAAGPLTDSQKTQLPLLASLSAGFAALPEIQAPAGFAAGVMQAIEALPDFETLSSVYDGEDSGVKISDSQLQPLRALSRAMAALPQPEAPADFVAKVMLATEKVSKPKLFALPGLFQTRFGKIAAGFAIFAMVAGMSYELKTMFIDGPQGGATVVQVDNSPEDMLFSNPKVNTVMDDTLEVDQPTEKDYNILIGG